MNRIAAIVLGATGYVGGEFLRLMHAHPVFRLAAAVSGSRGGQRIADVFPHLGTAYPQEVFADAGSWPGRLDRGTNLALLSAAPHGASADSLAAALDAAGRRDLQVRVVDTSADYRFSDSTTFEKIYGGRHPQPELLREFFCAVPEHQAGIPARHAAHPGCFATAIALACVPLAHAGIADDTVYVTGTTGSTGSGRSPQDGTHHPERHSNLYAYKPLQHRHVPEAQALVEHATTRRLAINFVPQSGPFARGIYVVVQAKLAKPALADDIGSLFRKQYAQCEFVRILDGVPKLKDVVASNYAHIGISVNGSNVVVICAIDNLVKGAAGGAMQWMNRLWSLPESTGLQMPAPAWS
ncbi:MAG: N-acetyl-gamma-glutamyl-phosphate reductase [Woeseiaceae bacterium]|nr:N-acetyl-gamma-glutamyl-phosphate reductase [Woeseiaceae bacterium]